MNKFHVDRIDFLRGIAIILVVSFHIYPLYIPNYEITTYSNSGALEISSYKKLILFLNPIGQGWIGVELFLIISGFLIHLIYLRMGSLNYITFFSKRFWRIYPPYILAVLFFYISNPDFSFIGVKNLLSHSLFIHNLSEDTFFTISPSFWSIALEVQLYLLYPLLILSIKRIGIRHSFHLTLLLHLILTVLGIFNEDIGNKNSYTTCVFNFWFVWVAGAYIADCFWNKRPLLNKSHSLVWFICLGLLFFILKLNFYTAKFSLISLTLAWGAFFEFVLYSEIVIKWKPIRGIIDLISHIGICSYSIYLLHQPFLSNLVSFFNHKTSYPYINITISLISTLIIIFFISYSYYQLIELKSINIGNKLRERWRNR